MKLHLFIPLIIALAACGKSKNLLAENLNLTPEEQGASASEIKVTETLSPVEGQAGIYRLQLTWQGHEKYSDLHVVKRLENEAAQPQTFRPSEASLSEENLKSGQVIEYQILGSWEGGKYLLYQNKILVPLDLVVSGSQVLAASFRSPRGRLFFEKGAVLNTQGRKLAIEAQEIFTDGEALIQTAPSAQAGMGEPGADGGLVLVRAKRVKGSLRILAQGQKGGKGRPGLPGQDGAAGSRGRDASPNLCAQRPDEVATNGGAGQHGGSGGFGQAGGVGGASAIVRVEVEEEGSQVVFERIPGLGGEGGDGGRGGAGGAGGAGGLAGANKHPLCNEAAKGPDGQTGVAGGPGPAGAAGLAAPYCLRLGTAEEGTCEQVPLKLFEEI